MKWSKALSLPNLLIPNTPGISAGDSIGSVHPHFLLKPLLHLGTLQHSIKSQHVHHTYRVEDQDQERLTCSIHDKHFLISYSYQTQIQSLLCLALSTHWLTKVTDALEIWFMWLWLAGCYRFLLSCCWLCFENDAEECDSDSFQGLLTA